MQFSLIVFVDCITTYSLLHTYTYNCNQICYFILDVCVCVCVCVSFALHPSEAPLDHPSRRLGCVSPVPQATPKDLVIIHSHGSTWVDLFWGAPIPS